MDRGAAGERGATLKWKARSSTTLGRYPTGEDHREGRRRHRRAEDMSTVGAILSVGKKAMKEKISKHICWFNRCK